MSKTLDPLVRAERTIERLVLDNTRLRGINKKLARRGGGYDDLIEEMREILQAEDRFKFSPSEKLILRDPLEPDHEEIAGLLVSDLHLAETVSKDDSNGLNVYNSVIAANRLWTHAQKVKSLLGRHRSLYTIKKIWAGMLGDMVSGSIHPELILTNDLTDPAAVILGSRLLTMFIEEISTLELPIEIDAVIGNHPRLTVKMPTKKAAHTNLDWVVYEMLADRYRTSDQVKFTTHTSQIAVKQLYGWHYLLEHGIDVTHGKEEDIESKLRSIFDDPQFRKAHGYRGTSFDQIVLGNTHHGKFLENIVVNGSYIGASELGMAWRLKPVRALQMLWGISKKHVRTFQYAIDLTDVKSQKAENAFSEYAVWFLKRYRK